MIRLDYELVSRGLCKSRERAKEYILSGQVYINSVPAKKVSQDVSERDDIELVGKTLKYVGRGGLKLESAIKVFNIDISGLICLDIGASTGGFTDCMLQSGAKRVYAVDVGHGQLAEKLRIDSRVVNIEGVNVKDFTQSMFPEPIDFATADLSFISAVFAVNALKLVLPIGKKAVLLIKPQFEAGREYLSKSGVVRDRKVHARVLKELCSTIEHSGFSVLGLEPSPILGGNGNVEYLAYIVKQTSFTQYDADFSGLVSRAFERVKL